MTEMGPTTEWQLSAERARNLTSAISRINCFSHMFSERPMLAEGEQTWVLHNMIPKHSVARLGTPVEWLVSKSR
jgi:hypothetical protein